MTWRQRLQVEERVRREEGGRKVRICRQQWVFRRKIGGSEGSGVGTILKAEDAA